MIVISSRGDARRVASFVSQQCRAATALSLDTVATARAPSMMTSVLPLPHAIVGSERYILLMKGIASVR